MNTTNELNPTTSLRLKRGPLSILTDSGMKTICGFRHELLGIGRHEKLYHVIHLPTGRSIIAAKRQRDARKGLAALVSENIDFGFCKFGSRCPHDRLKYDVSLAKCRFVVTTLIASGVPLIDPSDITN